MSNDRRSARLRHRHEWTDLDSVPTTFPPSSHTHAAADVVSGIFASARLPGSFSGFANPSASIGLTAVNGSATTAMRSDGAPALSQSITPTWTGLHTFNNNGTGILITRSANSEMRIAESSAAANNRLWYFGAFGEQLGLGVYNDAVSVSTNILTVDRTGTTIDKTMLPNGTVVIGDNGATAVVPTGNPGRMYVASPTAGLLGQINTSAAADQKTYDSFVASTGTLSFRAVNDAQSAATEWMYVTRTGVAVTGVGIPGGSNNSLILGQGGVSTFTNRMIVGSTTPTGPVGVMGLIQNNSAGDVIALHHTATSGNNLLAQFVTDASSTRGSIDYNRAGGVVRYNTTSDRRLKTNIEDAEDAGKIIDGIKVRQFDWKEPGLDHVEHGFIAQELQKHVPAAVREGDHGNKMDDIWQVDVSRLVPILVKEIQSLRARVLALESK